MRCPGHTLRGTLQAAVLSCAGLAIYYPMSVFLRTLLSSAPVLPTCIVERTALSHMALRSCKVLSLLFAARSQCIDCLQPRERSTAVEKRDMESNGLGSEAEGQVKWLRHCMHCILFLFGTSAKQNVCPSEVCLP